MTNYDIITSLGIEALDRAGDQKVRCPKCSHDRKKSNERCLYINVDKGVWKCYNPGCEWENGSGVDHYKTRRPMRQYTKPESTALTLDDKVKDFFLKHRGITGDVVELFRVTAGEIWMPQENKEVMAIHFNYYRDGELVNIKYRDAKKNFKMVSGAELILYGMDTVKQSEYIIITEGEFDAMCWKMAGYDAVSVPNGASTGANQRLEYIDNCYDWLSRFRKVYIATDADGPGMALSSELSRRLGRERCYQVGYPDGCKDANDVVLRNDVFVLATCYNNAQPFPLDAVLSANDVYDGLVHELETGLTPGVRLDNMQDFSELQTWRPGELTLVTGIPGHGKSSFVDNVMVSLARQHSWVFGVWSAEKPKVERHLGELYQIYLEKSFYLTTFDTQRISRIDIDTHRQFFDDHFKFIDTGTADLTIDGLLSKGRELVGRYGISALVLDNWATIEHSHSGKKSKHDYSGEALSKMQRWCKRNQCDIILVAHPNKDVKMSNGKLRPPNGYDVSDSSHFFNLVDNGLTVFRNPETGQTDVIKWKNRWRELGEIGHCHFTYNVYTGKFYQADPVNQGQSNEHFIGQTIKEANKFAAI